MDYYSSNRWSDFDSISTYSSEVSKFIIISIVFPNRRHIYYETVLTFQYLPSLDDEECVLFIYISTKIDKICKFICFFL